MGIVMPRMSASWKASVPIIEAPTWPVTATIGTESMCASAIGVTRLVAPGPEVAMQTPTLPVAAAYPCAACPAPCSWRTRMCRIAVESMSGSYAGRIAPPGMPKMFSAPAASSDLIRLCAPVICSLILWFLSSLVAITHPVRPTKNPSARGQRGVDARAGVVDSAHASRAYKNLLAHAITVAVGSRVRHQSLARVPTSGTRVPSFEMAAGRNRWGLSALGAARPGRHTGLVALGVGQHPERRGTVVADQRAARTERGLHARERLLGGTRMSRWKR